MIQFIVFLEISTSLKNTGIYKLKMERAAIIGKTKFVSFGKENVVQICFMLQIGNIDF